MTATISCVAEKWKKGARLVLDHPGVHWHGKQVRFVFHTDHREGNWSGHCCSIDLPGKWGGPCVERADRLKPVKARP